jgi:hypothetical protein
MTPFMTVPKRYLALLEESMGHYKQTWQHVMNGQSTLAEKVEFGAEATAAAVGNYNK